MIYFKLFWAFFQVGLFSFGGGYATLPMIQSQTVENNAWLSVNEFADIITISQMTPGPIALNTATFVGTRVAGLLGAISATLGCILPSCIIAVLLAILYKKYRSLKLAQGFLKGLQPAVVGLIGSAGLIVIGNALSQPSMALSLKNIDYAAVGIIALCLVILRKTKLNTIYVMLGAGVVGGLFYSLF